MRGLGSEHIPFVPHAALCQTPFQGLSDHDLSGPVYRNPRPVPPLKEPRHLLEYKQFRTAFFLDIMIVHLTESTKVQSGGKLCTKGHTALSSETTIKPLSIQNLCCDLVYWGEERFLKPAS